MSGNAIGGAKARDTNIARYGADFYNRIGRIGGKNGKTGGFASDLIGADGLTGRERARVAGVKGGKISRKVKLEDLTPKQKSGLRRFFGRV